MSVSPLPTTKRISTDSHGTLSQWYQVWFASLQQYVSALGSNNTTANRPTSVYIGYMYIDTTLGKPIWVKSLNPTVWIDATGGVV